ncbi:MAG: Fe-S protein assembly chaperone HscA [Planctomycetota bacterium]|jgi:molecular chaperone DnaK|nr:Fe-S protein assembly chaperone HscA [Planctomycetota bacterium]MDG2141920.1 Fe-S protein assembly chaperone HscA [Planctomycetota bacterium]
MAFLELTVLNNEPTPVVGIDLGTTNSLVARYHEGRPEILKPPGHPGTVPSAIYFEEGEEPRVGNEARTHAIAAPGNAIFSFKRFMGRGLADVAEDLGSVPFQATENEHGVVSFNVHGKGYTPQELSARVLRQVGAVAGEAIGSHAPLTAVITVPAYFDDAQRAATRDAARLAGIEVARIINEPTAASLAYGLDQKALSEGKEGGHTIAVYDFGGGTFDVSILSIEDGVFRVLATNGDTHLGGDDLDRVLVKLAISELQGQLDAEQLASPTVHQALRLAAEKCKIELTNQPAGELHVNLPEHDLNWRREVTREEFESLSKSVMMRTLACCRSALADADLVASDIHEVVLVGGSTRIPAVRTLVESFFGQKPHTELNPDEVVALGAAVQAHVLAGGTRDILLMDVTPLSLGMETMGGATSKVILRNAPIPCQHTEGFTTYADNQSGIEFNIVQGERELAKDCRSLGKFKLTGIPPMPAGMPKVAVRFALDANGMLTVTAKEETTGNRAEITVEPMNSLTDEQLEGMLMESFENAKEDFDASRLAGLVTELGTMLQASERGLKVAQDQLDPESLADLEEAMDAAREAQQISEPERVKEVEAVRDLFERATLPLAAILMDSVAKSAMSGKGLDDF